MFDMLLINNNKKQNCLDCLSGRRSSRASKRTPAELKEYQESFLKEKKDSLEARKKKILDEINTEQDPDKKKALFDKFMELNYTVKNIAAPNDSFAEEEEEEALIKMLTENKNIVKTLGIVEKK